MIFRADLEKHEYHLGDDQLDSITDCLKGAGVVEVAFATDHDLWVGTATHRAIELYNKGTLDLDTLDPDLRNRIDAWREFLALTGFKVKESEKSVYSPILRVAGTLDVLGDFPDGAEGIVEVKSGNVAKWCALQTAGQDILLGGKHRRRFGLKVPRYGKAVVTPHRNPDDYAVFMACVTVAHWKRSN
jgi:hypothetical protein